MGFGHTRARSPSFLGIVEGYMNNGSLFMKFHERDYFISRISSGFILYKHPLGYIKILPANPEQDYMGNEVYQETLNEAQEADVVDDQYIYKLLIDNDLWSDQQQDELDNIFPKHLEYWKKELYKAALKGNDRATIRKYLARAKEEYSKAFTLRHSYDYCTCHGVASYTRAMYVMSQCAVWQDGSKIDWNQVDLNKVLTYYNACQLSSEKIRYLARNTPWSNNWPIKKIQGKIFYNDILTLEQEVLISWSETYERIHESPDCPPDAIIEDDDMLDGWLLIQKEKRSQDKNKNLADKLVSKNPKIGQADDVFVVAQTKEDVKLVDSLNDPHSAKVKQQRLSQVKKHGVVKEQELADVKQKRNMQLTQAYSQSVKGK